MATASPTRMNLLKLRSRVRVAADGARLLRSKRDALFREFLRAVDTVVSSRTRLERLCREGTNALNLSLAKEGPEAVRSAGLAAARNLHLKVKERRVWGVPVPELTSRELVRSPEARGYSLTGTGILIDETATAFEKLIQQALQIASEEIRLKRIGQEIQKTSRRVNALEQILIPSLKREIRFIIRSLEERDRENVFRFKRLKARSTRSERRFH